MIVVDSSVWIDYLRGTSSPEAEQLDQLLGLEPLALGDLILAEVLQGIGTDREFGRVREALLAFTVFPMVGTEIAIKTASNYRTLRARGVTVRKTIDAIIATYCIENAHQLLYADRDFDRFVNELGLQRVSLVS